MIPLGLKFLLKFERSGCTKNMFSLFLSRGIAFKQFPARYTIRGSWNVPYTNLSNPIIISVEPSRTYTSKYNGLEQIWVSTGEERIYRKVVASDDKMICYDHQPEDGGEWDLELNEFLPKPDGYKKVGMRQHRGRVCEVWEKNVSTPKLQTWDIYIDPATGYPVSYIAHAVSLYHSHYDIYILDIDDFQPDSLPGAWNFPDICNGNLINDPYPGHGDNGFQAVKQVEHRVHQNKFQEKRSKFVNRLGGRRLTISNEDETICRKYTAKGLKDLPAEFSWRDVPNVVGKPRDQVACGSCWAFGTAESLESQLALKTGVFRELSVNQIMDCTWDYNNSACGGGEAGPAFRSLINQNFKLFLEKDYPYIGVAGYCNRNPEHPVARVVDCIAIDKSTQALKEALYQYGPASIGINVIESMSFYTKGAVNDPTCTGAADDLVHEVLLTGWKIVDGIECWEIKNSWSTHWGNEGYIYIQAENQEYNCGVTTDAKIPFIEVL